MAQESAFDKRHVDQRQMNDLGSVLEHLNLPPAVVTFVREHKRLVQIGAALIVIVVVSWALYDSHREKKVRQASSALALAMQQQDQQRLTALTEVRQNFAGTDAALWATIEIAHEMVKSDDVAGARERYLAARSEVGVDSPLYPLLAAGIAQTNEMLGDFQQAAAEYDYLRSVEGYEDIGYSGLGRINELQSDTAAALKIYEEYLSILQNDSGSRLQKSLIEEKIARIQASQ